MEHILDLRSQFPRIGEKVYLNAASEGPMPDRAIEEAVRLARMKEAPWTIGIEYYYDVPASVRARLETLIGAPPGSVALVPGTSAGITIASQRLPLEPGAEVLLLQGQFPSNTYPWRAVERRGATVRTVPRPFGTDPTEALLAGIGPKTKVLSVDWVSFMDGAVIDLEKVGTECRKRGIRLVVDAAQGIGAVRLDVSRLPIDLLAAPSHKWLLGPVGTGFLYVAPPLLDVLQPWNSGWVNVAAKAGFRNLLRIPGDPPPDATRFETGSPSYSMYGAWAVSLELLASLGPAAVERHVLALANRIVKGLAPLCQAPHEQERSGSGTAARHGGALRGAHDEHRDAQEGQARPHGVAGAPLTRLSPSPPRSAIVTFHAGDRTVELYRALESAGIVVAFREGAIRVAPHIYNSVEDVDSLVRTVTAFVKG